MKQNKKVFAFIAVLLISLSVIKITGGHQATMSGTGNDVGRHYAFAEEEVVGDGYAYYDEEYTDPGNPWWWEEPTDPGNPWEEPTDPANPYYDPLAHFADGAQNWYTPSEYDAHFSIESVKNPDGTVSVDVYADNMYGLTSAELLFAFSNDVSLISYGSGSDTDGLDYAGLANAELSSRKILYNFYFLDCLPYGNDHFHFLHMEFEAMPDDTEVMIKGIVHGNCACAIRQVGPVVEYYYDPLSQFNNAYEWSYSAPDGGTFNAEMQNGSIVFSVENMKYLQSADLLLSFDKPVDISKFRMSEEARDKQSKGEYNGEQNKIDDYNYLYSFYFMDSLDTNELFNFITSSVVDIPEDTSLTIKAICDINGERSYIARSFVLNKHVSLIKLVPGEVKDGKLKVAIVAEKCAGLTSADLVIEYDTAALKFTKAALGKDAKLCADTDNTFSGLGNETEAGKVAYAFNFHTSLKADEFLVKGESIGIDADNFEVAILSFDVVGDAVSTEIRLACEAKGIHAAFEGASVVLRDVPVYKEAERVEPTCETDGYILYRASDGDEYTEIIPAFGHIWDEGSVLVTPTCSANGIKEYICLNDHSHTKYENLGRNPDNHVNTVATEEKPATCTAPGYTSVIYCEDCETVLKKQQDIPVTDHKWDTGTVTKAATCKEAGVMTFRCTECEATKTEPIAKLTAHTYDAGKVTKAATCKEAGVKTFTCTVCGATKTESIAKLTTHTYDAGKCTVCGAADPNYDPMPAFRKGDVDNDGKVTAADARLALRASVGFKGDKDNDGKVIDWTDKTCRAFLAGNVDPDEKMTAADARLILRASVGLEKF